VLASLLVAVALADPCAREALIGRAPSGVVLDGASITVRVRTGTVRHDGVPFRQVRGVRVDATWRFAEANGPMAVVVAAPSALTVRARGASSVAIAEAPPPAWTFCERGGPVDAAPTQWVGAAWRVAPGARAVRTRFVLPAVEACRLRLAMDAAWAPAARVDVEGVAPSDAPGAVDAPSRDVVIDIPGCG
jgi:hypothetical protein